VNIITFREYTGNIQGTFREHSENIQETFMEHSGNVGTFRAHSGNIRPLTLTTKYEIKQNKLI
jgi:hypothetical protein